MGPHVRLTDIKTCVVGNPWKSWLFVRVETDEGLHGIGEGTLGQLSKTVEAAVHELEPMVLGFEPFQIEAIIHRVSRDIFADGGQIKMCALSAIKLACWDIVCKALGQPVYNLIGGRCRDNMRAYANG